MQQFVKDKMTHDSNKEKLWSSCVTAIHNKMHTLRCSSGKLTLFNLTAIDTMTNECNDSEEGFEMLS